MPDDSSPMPPAGAGPGDPPIQPRRRASPAKEAEAEAERAYEMADLADSVKALSERLDGSLRGTTAGTPPTEPAPRVSRRWKRIAGEPELPEPPETLAKPTPARPAAPRRRKPSAIKARTKRKRMPLSAFLMAQAFGFSLVGLGYVVGMVGTKSAPAPRTREEPTVATPDAPNFAIISRGVSERAFQAVNSAMTAAKRGDAGTARSSLESAQREQLGVPGADYRLALLALQRSDLNEAKLRLDCAFAANQELAGSCYIKAMLAGAIGDYSQASEECAKAAYAEPFNVRYLFFWAECLRRNGKLQPAIMHLEEALTRPASQSELEYIAFKLRLAKIEAGRAGDFAVEMAGRLAAERVSPLWVMTAAALELEANRPAAAAEHLQRATQLLSPADFDSQSRDYLFVAHAMEKEMAPYFMRTAAPVSPSPNVVAITVDPLCWSLQSADPATWPSALHR